MQLQLQLPDPATIDERLEVGRGLCHRVLWPQTGLIGNEDAQRRPRPSEQLTRFAPTGLGNLEVRSQSFRPFDIDERVIASGNGIPERGTFPQSLKRRTAACSFSESTSTPGN